MFTESSFRHSLLFTVFFLLWGSLTKAEEGHLNLHPRYDDFIVADKKLGVIYKKNVTSYSLDPDHKIEYKINNHGFRDHDFSYTKKKDKRILVFGGSRVFGLGIKVQDRWSNLLDQELKQWEVYNLSIVGLSLDLIYLQMREYMNQYQHDVMIISVEKLLPLDIAYHVKPFFWQLQEKPYFDIRDGGQKATFFEAGEFSIPKFLGVDRQENVFLHFVKNSINIFKRQYFERNTLHLTEEKSLMAGKYFLGLMDQLCREKKVDCVFLYRKKHVKEIFAELGLKSINIRIGPSHKYQVNDIMGHVNEEGQRITMNKVRDGLQQLRIIE